MYNYENGEYIDPKDQLVLHTLLALCSAKARNLDLMSTHVQKAFDIADNISNSTPDLILACGYGILGAFCCVNGNFDRMRKYANVAKIMFTELNECNNPIYRLLLQTQIMFESNVRIHLKF